MSIFFLIVSTGLVIFIFYFLIKNAVRRHKYCHLLPCRNLSIFNLLGHLTDIAWTSTSRNGFPINCNFLQLASAYNELFRDKKLYVGWITYVPLVFLVKSEAVEELISGTKNMEKAWLYKLLHPWLGTGLLTSHGEKWKSRRKLLTPSFHFNILTDFLPIFNEQSQLLVRLWKKETEKKFIDITLPIKLCSLDMIAETTLGVSIGAQENHESEYVKAISRVSETVVERMIKFWYWSDLIFGFTKQGKTFFRDIELLHTFTNSIIKERKAKLLNGVSEPSKSKRKALLDTLLEHHIQNQNISEEDIREEVDTFAFEGHDTTATGICWALYLIGLYKDVQEKVHEELDRIFGNDTERHVTVEDLKDMEYLGRVLKESQRLYPSVPLFARAVEENATICGYPIPNGAICIVVTYILHRDPDVFPNPEKFDPDRFLPQTSVNRNPYAYIPFSAGSRNCIGQRFAVMEEKIVIANILRNFVIVSLDERDKLPPVAALTLGSPLSIRIKIRSRFHN